MSIKKVQTSDGHRWRLRFYLGRDEDGRKRIYTETFDLKKDAEDKETELKGQTKGGALLRPSREALSDYLLAWIDNVKAGELSPQSLYDYRRTVRRYLVEDAPEDEGLRTPLGQVPVNKVTTEAIQRLYGHLRTERKLAPGTIRRFHAILRQGLSYAVSTGALGRNPTDAAKPPKRGAAGKKRRRPVHPMTREEARRFLDAAREDRLHALWAVLVTGGLRPGEALGLRWEDVDLEGGKIHIRHALLRRGLGGGWRLTEPKTKNGRRTVALPAVTVGALRTWRTEQKRERLKAGAEYEDHGLVFTTVFGQPLHQSNLRRREYRDVLEAAGLGTYEKRGKRKVFKPGFRLYDLRHTCATLLLLAGENPKIVSERLGHSTVALTLDTYSHVLPSMQEQAAEKLETMLGDGA